MYLEQTQVAAPQQTLNISAKLITSIKILQYSAEELEQSIARELNENPALDVEEVEQCARCGAPLSGGLCANCERAGADAANESRQEVASWDDDFAGMREPNLTAADDDEYDPLNFVRTGVPLEDYLLRQLGVLLTGEEAPIAEYLAGSLSSHGYLTVTVEEVAETLRAPVAVVERVLATLQSLDPPGIGARDLRECLLIQLAQFEERGEAPAVARPLLERHLAALGEHHFAEIARDLGVTVSTVKNAWRFIRSNLNPYPAHAFESSDVPDVGLSMGNERSVLIRPDVVIRRTEQGFEAEVVERRRFRFGMNPVYSSLYSAVAREHSAATHANARRLSDSERQHIRQYAARTRFFIECVRQRWETLTLISEALIRHQYEFLDKGVRYLKPLTRGELAEDVGLHESTVSRATANKYVLLPNGQTVSFDDFFDGSLAAKDTLRELIDCEDPRRPFSDEDLASLMHERGLPLARRTVAKYREALGILPSRFRI